MNVDEHLILRTDDGDLIPEGVLLRHRRSGETGRYVAISGDGRFIAITARRDGRPSFDNLPVEQAGDLELASTPTQDDALNPSATEDGHIIERDRHEVFHTLRRYSSLPEPLFDLVQAALGSRADMYLTAAAAGALRAYIARGDEDLPF